MFSCNMKSEAVKNTEDAINAIGTVTENSAEAIEKAEKLYGILTDEEKSKVSNRLTLVSAREEYDALVMEKVFQNASIAFDKLNQITELCVKGMDDIYDSWYIGLYESDISDIPTKGSLITLISEKTSFSNEELVKACNDLNLRVLELYTDWNYCIWIVEQAHVNRGTYDRIHTLLTEVNSALKEIGDSYSDYEYYPTLKSYYAKASSYADFFENTTGSFNQLADTINDYENALRTYQSDLSFIFQPELDIA